MEKHKSRKKIFHEIGVCVIVASLIAEFVYATHWYEMWKIIVDLKFIYVRFDDFTMMRIGYSNCCEIFWRHSCNRAQVVAGCTEISSIWQVFV